MSAFIVQAPHGFSATAPLLRFGRPDGEAGTQWLLKRNCSISPRQLFLFYLSLAALSLSIACAFWLRGAPYVLPFAGLELVALAAALAIYARHAVDRERLMLSPGTLTVECTIGKRTDRVEFAPAWVRVEPEHGDRSLIELSGEGKRIAVGRFVRPELRRALADELRAALRRCASSRLALDARARGPADPESES